MQGKPKWPELERNIVRNPADAALKLREIETLKLTWVTPTIFINQ